MQYYLEFKTSECTTKTQENEEVKMRYEYKISKYIAEIEKLEAKLEKVFPEIDRRIFDLQS